MGKFVLGVQKNVGTAEACHAFAYLKIENAAYSI